MFLFLVEKVPPTAFFEVEAVSEKDINPYTKLGPSCIKPVMTKKCS